MIKEIKNVFVYLSIVIGNKHNFLWINIGINNNIIHIDMVKHLREYMTMFV